VLPEQFLKRLQGQKYINAPELIEALKEPSPVSIRINRRKWPHIPAGAEMVPWCNEGWYLEKRPVYTLDPLFHSGCYYPQEGSGMFIGEFFRQVINNRGNLRVLDLCGAPGGKSTHLSSLMGEGSLLVANEVIKSRASILSENITKWGSSNTIVTNNDPSAFSRLKGYFDVILADAPCSGEGMFRDQTAVKEWSSANAALCSDRQRRILNDVWPSLKEGGVLFYSTCTFNPSENEENVKWLVEKNKSSVVEAGIEKYHGIQKVEYEGIHGYGFYPGKVRGEGFFVSAIRKHEPEKEVIPGYRSKTEISRATHEDRQITSGWLVKPERELLRIHQTLYSLPVGITEFVTLSKILNIIKKGTEVFTWKNMDPIPSHELVLSEIFRGNAFESTDLDFNNAIRFLKKDIMKKEACPAGWLVVKHLGVNLGLAKNVGQRINNYYPTEWRVRMDYSGKGDENRIRWISEPGVTC
jgi:16S rRNA C967 or C1407 C5-methylase (RsmB/RsmF family)/NOL1/NOP2/fmu family ribosome biogenesis protein